MLPFFISDITLPIAFFSHFPPVGFLTSQDSANNKQPHKTAAFFAVGLSVITLVTVAFIISFKSSLPLTSIFVTF